MLFRSQGPVRAIAISGYSSPEDLARSKAAGFLMHLAKPVEAGTLIQAIEQLVNGQDGAGTS